MLAGKHKFYGSFREREQAWDLRKNAMGSGDWMTAHGTEVAAGGDYRQPTAYALRPLSLGEILDRSFTVYRANFWLFVGIAVLSAVVQLLGNAVVMVIYKGIIPHPKAPLDFSYLVSGREIGNLIATLVFFLAAAITQAATVWALSEVYLGRRTSIETSIRAVAGRWLRFVGIALWQAWSMLWLPLLLIAPAGYLLARSAHFGVVGAFAGGVLIFLGTTGGAAFGIIAFLRNSLAVPAAVVEELGVRKAMRRSKVLAAGAKGRIFVVLLITWCLFIVAGIIETPLVMIIGLGAVRGERHLLLQVVILFVNCFAHSVVMPVMMIGLSLVYFDQRVRQDGYDLLVMLDAEAKGTGGNAPPTLQSGEPASDAAAL
jgi:hypothetical protein